MGPRFQNSLQSNFDQTAKISKSVFISNFPDDCSNRDLWKVCSGYGTVVDVFIPNKRSKTGKRFAVVRFIKVLNFDRLIENLKTIWIGHFYISANPARFERPKAPIPQKQMSTPSGIASGLRQPTAQHKSGSNGTNFTDILKPALVLDDSCLVNRDIAKCVMGEVRQFSSINNLQVLLFNEGFHISRIVYLGGLWVMIELNSSKSKSKFMEHVGVALWFHSLCNAQPDFAAKERIVWVNIEGAPLNAWSRLTFQKIGSKWGELVDLEDRNFLFGPHPSKKFLREIFLDDESIKTNKDANNLNLGDAENDSEVVSNIYFGDNGEDHGVDQHQAEPSKVQEYSVPPGFTPINDIPTGIQDNLVVSSARSPSNSVRRNSSPYQSNGLSSRVMEDMVPADVYTSFAESKSKHGSHKGGSMLEVLDGMVKVGQAMGFSMDGCLKDMEIMIGKKDWIRELNHKHKVSFLTLQETKMECIYAMEAKIVWGNSIFSFDHVFSEALGNSGGILCLWDPLMFRKDHHIISDNFVLLYGTWVPNNAKLLIVSVYAPQSVANKILLWSYITGLLSRWKGEVLVTRDFNEVRFERERLGSVFNVRGANEFNSFISNARLVEIQFEGFSFTWSHSSAVKMSKLYRFLVSEGFLSLFPHISALYLDKNMSDHRPILLRELVTDYGATPFRLYHSWFYFRGFDDMVRSTWNSFVLEDSNGMVRFQKKLQMLKKEIRSWVADHKRKQSGRLIDIQDKLGNIDHTLDQDVKGVMIDGEWVDEPDHVKEELRSHFAIRFQDKGLSHCRLNFRFPSLLSADQIFDLEKPVSYDEIRKAVWSCGENKSPRPDGFTFEFFRKFWDSIGPDMCVATAFLPNRQILDGPFIINELLSLCRHKKQQAMVFKVDFAKAYDSVRWDYLDDVLSSFGFGVKWRSWIKGSLTSEFQFHCGLKQGDPLALYLFILVMESLHLLVFRAVEAGIFFAIKIDPTISISHLFYADDAIFIAAGFIGCSVMKAPFKYLGVMVGSSMSKISAWDEMVGKIKSRLSKWMVNTLSIGCRLTLLKAVLGSTPIYPMSLYKVSKSVLHEMESLRRNFLMVLKVSIGRFRGLSGQKCSLLRNLESRSSSHCSNWLSILREVSASKLQGIDFLSHCKRHVGSGMQTRFWEDLWLGETPFRELFPRLYALENNKDCSVVVKMQGEIDISFRRQVRGGVESQQLEIIKDLVRLKVLSNVDDRWAWDLNGDGDFCVKDARDLVDEVLLPKQNVATRWIKTIPIKMNVFAWKLRLDRLPTSKTHPIFSFPVTWLQLFLGVYVDGGTFLGAQLILIWAGWSGLFLFEWDISLKGS
uniref:RNA-directed DNA polymerase, eukaryota n=1 Tax=Tanacetum cinerariifolium TaxID=118510 RepID=A0A6L2P297_TANCI|nr:RNA-directed DNA polymerase, eukaryota [Tanacetum cinerariifolium]